MNEKQKELINRIYDEVDIDLSYEIENINSELLATLLKQQEASEKIYDYKDEVEKLFYNEVE